MRSAYAVGASFTIENLASPTIGKLAGELTDLNKIVEDTKLNLKNLLPTTLTAKVDGLAASFAKLGPAASEASTAMIAAMDKANVGISAGADKALVSYDAAFAGMDKGAKSASAGMVTAMDGATAGHGQSRGHHEAWLHWPCSRVSAPALRRQPTALRAISPASHAAPNNASRAIVRMRTELASLSNMSNLPLPQLPGIGRRRLSWSWPARQPTVAGNGSNGGFHFDTHESIGTPGGRLSAHGAGGAALGAAVLVGDAVVEAAKLEDVVTKILITSQLQPGESPLSKNADGGKIKELIQSGAAISGFSQDQVGEMFLGTEREFQGFDFSKKVSTMEQMLPAISAEARLRDESLAEAGKSLIGVLHQSGLFTPEEMMKGAKEFQFTTMATPVGLEQFKNALSYTMTPLHGGLGMDTGTIMLMTSLMQSAGISNSKAGTWTRSLFTQSEPSTDVLGPLTKTQVQHNEALKMLGIVGGDGKQNWHVNGADGKIDWNSSVIKMFTELHDGMQKIPEGERNDVLHRAFGTQGAGAATLFSQANIIDQLAILKTKMGAFTGGDVSLAEYSKGSTLQQSRIAMQEFQVLMADLGTTILPSVNSVLREFSEKLHNIPGDWEKTKQMWGDRLAPFVKGYATPAQPDNPAVPAAPPHDYSQPDTDAMKGLWQLNSYETGGNAGANSPEDTIYRGTLRAFTDFAAGKTLGSSGGGSSGGGFINASYETGDSGGGTFGGSAGGYSSDKHGGAGTGRIGGGGSGNFSGNIGDGSAIDRALGMTGAREGQAATALKHIMHAGEWCADFVNANIEAAGGKGSGSAMARSFMGWGHGVGLNDVQKGDVAVLNGGGHVGMFTGERRTDGRLGVVAGNTRDGHGGHDVEHYFVSPGSVYGARRGDSGVRAWSPKQATPTASTPSGNGQAGTTYSHHDITAMLDVLHAAVQRPVHVNLDGKQISKTVVKTMASNMRFPTGMGGPDGHGFYSNAGGTPAIDAA